VVIFYLFYAVVYNKIDAWVRIDPALFGLEGVILLMFFIMCLLAVMARKYSDSAKDNFDILLPNWLARNTKLIYTGLLAIILIFRLLTN
jgi:hypothetical protein